MARRGRSCKQLLDDLKEKEDIADWERTRWIALCGEFALEEAMECRKTAYAVNVLCITKCWELAVDTVALGHATWGFSGHLFVCYHDFSIAYSSPLM